MSILIRDKAFYKKALGIMVPVTAQQMITVGVDLPVLGHPKPAGRE